MTIKDPLEAASKGGLAGAYTTERNYYDMYLTDKTRPMDELRNDPRLKGEEMLDMEVLLPRQSEGGKLYMGMFNIQFHFRAV